MPATARTAPSVVFFNIFFSSPPKKYIYKDRRMHPKAHAPGQLLGKCADAIAHRDGTAANRATCISCRVGGDRRGIIRLCARRRDKIGSYCKHASNRKNSS